MTEDIYEFPKGYTGRKTYVSVAGHRRSLPIVYTYKAPDGRNRLLPEFGGGPIEYTGAAPMIMRDMTGYVSPLDGSEISSRSAHRAHMAEHDVIELGNERIKPKPETTAFSGKHIKERLDEVRAMPQRQYDEQVAKQQKEQVSTGA